MRRASQPEPGLPPSPVRQPTSTTSPSVMPTWGFTPDGVKRGSGREDRPHQCELLERDHVVCPGRRRHHPCRWPGAGPVTRTPDAEREWRVRAEVSPGGLLRRRDEAGDSEASCVLHRGIPPAMGQQPLLRHARAGGARRLGQRPARPGKDAGAVVRRAHPNRGVAGPRVQEKAWPAGLERPVRTRDARPHGRRRPLGRNADGESPLPDDVGAALRLLEPATLTRYRRLYYLSADRRFRLTLDTDLAFYRVRTGSRQLVRVPDTFGGTVIEVKYGAGDDEAARPVLEALPFRWSRFSKYCAAFDAA